MISRRTFAGRVLGVAAATPFVRHLVPLFEATPIAAKAALKPGLGLIPMSSIVVDHSKSFRAIPAHKSPFFEGLVKSIREMGLMNPITVNARGEVISGFARVEAAKKLGFTEIMADVRPEFESEGAIMLASLQSNCSTCVVEVEAEEDGDDEE